MNNTLIRKFSQKDRQSVKEISIDTSFIDKPGEFIDDHDIVAGALTLYFTEHIDRF